MHGGTKLPGFVYLASFERAAKGLFSAEAQHELEAALIANPEAGPRIAGTGGVRKLRFAVGGRGKSGGLRVIYYFRSNLGRIYLITAYPKNMQDNLTGAQRNAMQELTARLDREA